jgi:hypothetical protein
MNMVVVKWGRFISEEDRARWYEEWRFNMVAVAQAADLDTTIILGYKV